MCFISDKVIMGKNIILKKQEVYLLKCFKQKKYFL